MSPILALDISSNFSWRRTVMDTCLLPEPLANRLATPGLSVKVAGLAGGVAGADHDEQATLRLALG
jgi:hypothetical protein